MGKCFLFVEVAFILGGYLFSLGIARVSVLLGAVRVQPWHPQSQEMTGLCTQRNPLLNPGATFYA